jgi:hypothetical protein
MSSAAGVTEAAGTARCFTEGFLFLPNHTRVRCNNKLCNPISATDDEVGLPKVGEDHPHFATVIGIDGSG